MGTRIKVEKHKCVGAGLCTVASEYFDLDNAGKVLVLQTGDVPAEDLETVADAVSMCPAEALLLQEQA